MTVDQLLILGLLGAMLVVFAMDWFRVEVVALVGLAAAVLLHLVPFDRAFSGLANPAVITVLEILLIVQVLQNSRLLDKVGEILGHHLKTPATIALALGAVGAMLSMVMNNIGAFSLLLPVVFSLASRHQISQRQLVMPLSFATLMGGMCTVVGTPPNLIVSEALINDGGGRFRFLDFLPTGLVISVVGVILLVWWAPHILGPEEQEQDEEEDGTAGCHQVATEVFCSDAGKSPVTVTDVEAMIEGRICGAVRKERRVFPLLAETRLEPGDRLLIEADDILLGEAFAEGRLVPARATRVMPADPDWVEVQAAILPFSMLQGSVVANIGAFSDRAINVIGVTSQSCRLEGPLDEFRLSVGDILHLEGNERAVSEAISNTGLVAVASSGKLFSMGKRSKWTLILFLAGMLAAAFAGVPPEIAYGLMLIGYLLGGLLDLREAISRLNWPIILLLVAVLPLGEAVGNTGAATTIARAMLGILPDASAVLFTFVMLILAVFITPFVNNATTAVLLAPIAIELSHTADLPPAMLLMAVAIGASCDFLTPFGHHNNTLAYALGPYRFKEFFLVGWPITLATVVVGTIATVLIWG